MILLALDTMSLDCSGIEAIGKSAPWVLLAIDDILRLKGAVEVPGDFGVARGLEDVLDGEDGTVVLENSLVEEDVVDELAAVEVRGDTLAVGAVRVDFAT